MVPSRSYWLDCHSTRKSAKGKDKDEEINTRYSVHCSGEGGDLSKKPVATFRDKQCDELLHFISELDYLDSQPPGPVKRTISSESGESVDLERPPADKFTFNIHYSDEASVRNSHAKICTSVVERLVNLHQLVELHLLECPFSEESEQLIQVGPAYDSIQFGPAYNLKVLKLEKLNLHGLHPSVGRLRSLSHLSLRYNRLTDLPLTIRLLRNLRHLDITGNPFSRLPGAVYHLHLDTISGLNECPLNKDIGVGWTIRNQDIWWRKPLDTGKPRESVDTLQEYCIQAAVGMDCWQLELQERYTQRLTEMAETQGLCENCLKSVRKLTIEHESLGYTIHARVAVFCGWRDVPFSFIACSQQCLDRTLGKLLRANAAGKRSKGFDKLPYCEYSLEFVQDLEEYRMQRALLLLPSTFKFNKSAYESTSTRSDTDSTSRCSLS